MALQTAVVTSSPLKPAPSSLRLRGSLGSLARTVWGLAVGLLFILAFPLAIVLAPVLWVIGKARGDGVDD